MIFGLAISPHPQILQGTVTELIPHYHPNPSLSVLPHSHQGHPYHPCIRSSRSSHPSPRFIQSVTQTSLPTSRPHYTSTSQCPALTCLCKHSPTVIVSLKSFPNPITPLRCTILCCSPLHEVISSKLSKMAQTPS